MKRIAFHTVMAAIVIGSISFVGANTVSASSDCRYANFINGPTAVGIVQVCGVHPGTIGTVTVLVKTNRSGSAKLCNTDTNGLHCSGVANSAFNAGCVAISYPMGLGTYAQEPQEVQLSDEFFNEFASAPLKGSPSHSAVRSMFKACFR